MELREARAVVAAVLTADYGNQFVVRPLLKELALRLPGVDWAALAAEVDPHLAPVVAIETLRAQRGEVIAIAARHGLLHLRWSPSRCALIASPAPRAHYGDLFDVEHEVAELVGGGVEIIAEGAPITEMLDDLEPL
jgi:hypothetical protein